MTTEPHVWNGIYELTNAQYHADPVDGGSLSASGAKTILKTPALFDWQRNHPVFKDVYDFGSAAHKLVLQDETEILVVIDADNYNTKKAQEARDEARNNARIPILRPKLQIVEAMAAQILAHPTARTLFEPSLGRSEPSLFWQDDRTGVTLRCKPDWLPHPAAGRMSVPDYKTAADASPEGFQKAVANYGYHIQATFYQDGIRKLGIDADPAFVFVVQEKEPPYQVAVYELDLDAEDNGKAAGRRAIDTFAACKASGVWPSYPTEIQEISLPNWYTYENHEEMRLP